MIIQPGEGAQPTEADLAAWRRIDQLTEAAWNHSRPFPEEIEFQEMTPLFRERLRAFAHQFVIMMGIEGRS